MEGDNFSKIGFSIGCHRTGFSMFLADRTKKVHFIRHAEGTHNEAARESGSNDCLQDMQYWDAPLTNNGVEQCMRLRRELAKRPSNGRKFTHFDLIVVSPLTRTLQSAEHIFGPARSPGTPACLAARFEATDLPRPKVLVREECRERISNACDGRRPLRELIADFPHFDFSEVEADDDVFYSPTREPSEAVSERAIAFLEWLNKRPEKCIAVVTHSSFLRHLFAQFGADQTLEDKDNLQRSTGNCELRSVVLCSHGVKDGRSVLVREECRERISNACDGRRPLRELIADFPHFDFSEVGADDDVFYSPTREPSEAVSERAIAFLEWLNKRPEKCIAVVTHSSFLRHLFAQFGADQTLEDKDNLQRSTGNCELRSVVLCSHGVKDGRSVRSVYSAFGEWGNTAST